MPYIDISSLTPTPLADLGLPSILLKQVEIIEGDYDDFFRSIKIVTVFPDGRNYQSLFSALEYWSNTRPELKTDRPIDTVIHYCAFTTLQIHSPEKMVQMRLTYASSANDNLIILVKKDLDGYTFSLPQSSVELILSLDKNAIPVRSIFISYTIKSDFSEMYGKITDHILPVLTGLSNDQLAKLKAKILIDAATNTEIHSF